MKVEPYIGWVLVAPYRDPGEGATHLLDPETLHHKRSGSITNALNEWCTDGHENHWHSVGNRQRARCWKKLKRRGYHAIRVKLAQVKR